MDGGILFVAIVISCAIGGAIGNTVGRPGAGIIAGLFLGPLGWIIVLLLPREATPAPTVGSVTSPQPSSASSPLPRNRDLADDAYKLYLSDKYNVQKNDLFDKYVCNEQMFDSLEEALAHADSLEGEAPAIENAPPLEDATSILRKLGFLITGGPDSFRVVDPQGVPAFLDQEGLRILAAQKTD